jgi:hypothetical protein
VTSESNNSLECRMRKKICQFLPPPASLCLAQFLIRGKHSILAFKCTVWCLSGGTLMGQLHDISTMVWELMERSQLWVLLFLPLSQLWDLAPVPELSEGSVSSSDK